MPQPILGTFAGHRICTFGGLAQPKGQGVLTPISLNDVVTPSWVIQWDQIAASNQQDLALAQLLFQGEATYLSSDFGPEVKTLPMEYVETGGVPFASAVAKLMFAGEQQLTFDNLTFAYVRFRAVSNQHLSLSKFGRWTFDLELQAREQWFRDMAPSTVAAVTLASGSATNFNVTYGGSVFARPKWTLHIPASNVAPIQSFVLLNVMSGESLTLNFPGNLLASTLYDIVIDGGFDPIAGGAFTVVDGSGTTYDPVGSFPMLYGPPGTVNAIRGTLTPASGTATGCTIAASYVNRWLGPI